MDSEHSGKFQTEDRTRLHVVEVPDDPELKHSTGKIAKLLHWMRASSLDTRGARDTWSADTDDFAMSGQLARSWLRRAVDTIFTATPLGAIDVIEAHVRSWLAARPKIPQELCDAVRGVLRDVITEVQAAHNHNPPPDPLGVILRPTTRSKHDNERPPPPPHLRI